MPHAQSQSQQTHFGTIGAARGDQSSWRWTPKDGVGQARGAAKGSEWRGGVAGLGERLASDGVAYKAEGEKCGAGGICCRSRYGTDIGALLFSHLFPFHLFFFFFFTSSYFHFLLFITSYFDFFLLYE